MGDLVLVLLPAFFAGLAVQQLLELFDNVIERFAWAVKKKWAFGFIAAIIGIILATAGHLRLLESVVNDFPTAGLAGWAFLCADVFITGLIVSGGTESFNSIQKFLMHAKEEKAAEAKKKDAEVEKVQAETATAQAAISNGAGSPPRRLGSRFLSLRRGVIN